MMRFGKIEMAAEKTIMGIGVPETHSGWRVTGMDPLMSISYADSQKAWKWAYIWRGLPEEKTLS